MKLEYKSRYVCNQRVAVKRDIFRQSIFHAPLEGENM